MRKLDLFIKSHFEIDKSRSSLSNLTKKIKLNNELFLFIDNYIDFGTIKQKLYHYQNNIKDDLLCPICQNNKTNWVEKDNHYRKTCSSNCSGKLDKINKKKIYTHPILSTNEEFIKYFSLNKIKLIESSLSNNYPKLVEEINSRYKFNCKYYSEKVYCYLYDLESAPLCKNCNIQNVEFDTFTNGYHDYCSIKCSSNSFDKRSKIEKTCLDKYGVKNIGEITREKASNTMNIRYGGHISTTGQYKDKFKNTLLKNYGEDSPFKVKEIKERINKILIDKYGSIYPMQNKYIVEKNLQTKKDNGIIYKWTDQELKSIENYRRSICYYTEISYNEYKHILNPDNLERGILTNHVDHIYPVIEGWKNKIDPKLMSNYKNLRLVSSYDNLSKGERTKLTIDDFYKIIKNI